MAHQEHNKYEHTVLHYPLCRDLFLLAEKLDPQPRNYSPVMTAIVEAILGYDYGVRDLLGGRVTDLSITSDGFVIASTTSLESGTLVANAEDFDRNLKMLLDECTLNTEEKPTFERPYILHVTDWRNFVNKGV